MSQLNRKCFLASATLHGLLFLVLLVGPAFFISREEPDNLPTLDIIPATLIDEKLYRQVVPTPQPPQPQRQPVQPAPKPVEPAPKPVEPAKPEPKPEKRYTKPAEISISTKRTTPVKPPPPKPAPSASALEAAKAIRALTSSTSITVPTGSVAYANYDQAIKSLYESRWIPPDTATSDNAMAKIRITIARDGTVLSRELIGRSGDPAVDASVRDTLQRVSKVPPFPKGATEKTRTYTIGFNLKAKR